MNATEKEINGIKLEICSNSSYSALQAQLGGASRVEFCQNLENGGITPSYAQIMRARQLLHIGMHVLIRPRGGDFVYSDDEFEEMKMDISFCKDAGCDGVVIGILSPDGSVDRARNATLVALAKPMTVVFHRAFDRTKNPSVALQDVIELGFDRILTSGLKNTAEAGQDVLRDLVQQADGRIEIMPGAGVNAQNMIEIIRSTGAKSIHSSAKISVNSKMTYTSDALEGMNEPTLQTSRELVEELKGLLETR
ncbi:copper homeostasis protein CutC [Sphingobacterium deserti]|uniref:PF03932 family protein CutC n=1 Tax=Sphingobacterium deserti TaxID=1229276 RepID=A0A0B8T0C1_9SPHI|nr:copper homeostasis protein CutC [Sphingobacterium deserti]KGE13671.1 copper homeostasis protein CutC [Sphingobacterium deserti]